MTVKAFISGCAGTRLTPEETDFFAAEQPWGLILFKRNCRTPTRSRNWSPISATASAVPGAGADRPGGRTRPAPPPRWPAYPPGGVLGAIAEADPEEGARAAWLQARLIASDLADLGITVDCLPVLDVIVAGATEGIGNRSFGGDPALVTRLGQATADGLVAGGILPVMKHMPGHGRAAADSHYALPVVDADLATLGTSDFVPFAAFADLPMAMTSHVVYTRDRPATTRRPPRRP